MADSEINILITAVDNASKRIDEIESKLSGAQKNMSKATENTTASFEKQISSLVAVGNVASSADRIMSSYQNLQIRLENATDRLTNAQERLSKAQRNYNKVLKDSKSSSDDVRDARLELEQASRGLNIAENNLQRTQNQVVGTYINMGVQTLTLARSLPSLVSGLNFATISSKGLGLALRFATGPLLPLTIAIAAVTAVFVHYKKIVKEVEEAQSSLDGLYGELEEATTRYGEVLTKLADKYGIVKDAADQTSKAMKDMVSEKTSTEIQGEIKLNDLREQLRQQDLSETEAANIEKQINEEERLQDHYESNRTAWDLNVDLDRANRLELQGGNEESLALSQMTHEQIAERVAQLWGTTFENTVKTNEALMLDEKAKLEQVIIDLEAKIAEVSRMYDELMAKKAKVESAKEAGMALLKGGILARNPSKKKVNDAIIRPNGDIIETHPRDTLIATQNPGALGGGKGITINIQNLVANDARSVASTLQRLLLEKINI